MSLRASVQVSVGIPAFTPFGFIARSRIVGSYGDSVFNLGDLHTVSHEYHCVFLPAVNAQESQFPHIFTHTCFLFSVSVFWGDSSDPDGCLLLLLAQRC